MLYELCEPKQSVGKRGQTTKGRLAELKKLDPLSERAAQLREAICTIEVHRCGECGRLFRYASELN